MSEIITTTASRVEILEPWEAGERDLPMQDWLQLPQSDESCPKCGSSHWGTENPIGYFAVRYCKDEHGIKCTAKWRGVMNPQTIKEIVSALCGERRRLGRGPVKSNIHVSV